MGGGFANAEKNNLSRERRLVILEMRNRLFWRWKFYVFSDGQFDFCTVIGAR
jgi:hypothetical protein